MHLAGPPRRLRGHWGRRRRDPGRARDEARRAAGPAARASSLGSGRWQPRAAGRKIGRLGPGWGLGSPAAARASWFPEGSSLAEPRSPVTRQPAGRPLSPPPGARGEFPGLPRGRARGQRFPLRSAAPRRTLAPRPARRLPPVTPPSAVPATLLHRPPPPLRALGVGASSSSLPRTAHLAALRPREEETFPRAHSSALPPRPSPPPAFFPGGGGLSPRIEGH